jgi:hypothetical protein
MGKEDQQHRASGGMMADFDRSHLTTSLDSDYGAANTLLKSGCRLVVRICKAGRQLLNLLDDKDSSLLGRGEKLPICGETNVPTNSRIERSK